MNDELKKAICPKIILKGWWWKKYIPYYRKHSDAMNKLFMHEWMNGGYERYQDRILTEIFHNSFTTHYTKTK